MNSLSPVMRFLATGAASGSGLGAAQVLGARQFVAGVIDHFIRPHFRWRVRTELGNLRRNYNDGE